MKKGEEGKVAKFSALTDQSQFQPIAVEISGVFGPSYMKFLENISSKIAKKPVRSEKQSHCYSVSCVGCFAGQRLLGYWGYPLVEVSSVGALMVHMCRLCTIECHPCLV